MKETQPKSTITCSLIATELFAKEVVAQQSHLLRTISPHQTYFAPASYMGVAISVVDPENVGSGVYVLQGQPGDDPSYVSVHLTRIMDTYKGEVVCADYELPCIYVRERSTEIQRCICGFIESFTGVVYDDTYRHWSSVMRTFTNSLKVPMEFCYVGLVENTDVVYIANPDTMIGDGYAEIWRDSVGGVPDYFNFEKYRVASYYNTEVSALVPIIAAKKSQ